MTPTPDAPELLPCPFCGGDAIIETAMGAWRAQCLAPGCVVMLAVESEVDAIAAWNRRAPVVATPPSVGPDGRYVDHTTAWLAELERLRTENEAGEGALYSLRAKCEALKAELANLRAENEALRAGCERAVKMLNAADMRLREANAEADEARADRDEGICGSCRGNAVLGLGNLLKMEKARNDATARAEKAERDAAIARAKLAEVDDGLFGTLAQLVGVRRRCADARLEEAIEWGALLLREQEGVFDRMERSAWHCELLELEALLIEEQHARHAAANLALGLSRQVQGLTEALKLARGAAAAPATVKAASELQEDLRQAENTITRERSRANLPPPPTSVAEFEMEKPR